MIRSWCRLMLALALLTARAAPAQPSYTLTKLWGIGGFGRLNNSGQVAFASQYPQGLHLWTPATPNGSAGTFTDLHGLASAGAGASMVSAINDRGQVAGTTTINSVPQPFLWSPDQPNGVTGSAVLLLPSDSRGATPGLMNNFGQVTGSYQTNGMDFLWTPTVRNGATGSVTSDSRYLSLVGISDFGQLVSNTLPNGFMFFTPDTANGTTGQFLQISVLPGSAYAYPGNMARDGTVLGTTCIGTRTSCQPAGFFWNASSRNGTTGTVSTFTTPDGYGQIFPFALNTKHEAVGVMNRLSDGSQEPFVFTGGSVYDLSRLDRLLETAQAVAINDAGQILVDGLTGLFLLTPRTTAPPPPATPVPTIASVQTAGGYPDLAPNDWIEIKGSNLGPAAELTWSTAPEFAAGKMPTQLGGVSVEVNGKAAYVSYVSATQINALTPLDGSVGPVQVVVHFGSAVSAPFSANRNSVAPSLLLTTAKYALAAHGDGTLVGPAYFSQPGYPFTPAQPGETVVLYAVGLGLPATVLTEGAASQTGALPSMPSVQVGSAPAQVQYAGAIGPGLYQLNVTVPAAAAATCPITVTYAGLTSPAGVSIEIQR